ncbi:unnamed protein product [Auanema sp. JU1783]|nr:unnamed protein product [Auanema sp. JU1783]
MPFNGDALHLFLQQMKSTLIRDDSAEVTSSAVEVLLIERLAIAKQELESSQRKEGTVFPARNRYGRPYISGRPLLTCDRKKILQLFQMGIKKIHIAKSLGITHSCVSKVLRKFHETGSIEARVSRTASCSCPGSSTDHDSRFCKHISRSNAITKVKFTIENILKHHESREVVYYSKPHDR